MRMVRHCRAPGVQNGQVGDASRQGEYDVIVGDRQQLRLALGQPLACCRSLTLRAMPVAAGVVGDDGVRALLTTLDMPAERCRSTALDRRHHLELAEAEYGRHWQSATPPRGRGRYPRPPASD